jgi:hypothetical protein
MDFFKNYDLAAKSFLFESHARIPKAAIGWRPSALPAWANAIMRHGIKFGICFNYTAPNPKRQAPKSEDWRSFGISLGCANFL